MKILPGVKEIWSRHQIQGSNSWPSTVTLMLSPQAELWVLHIVPLRWTFDQSLEKILLGVKEIQRTQNSRLKPVTLNCDLVSLHGWAMGSAHHFTEANIWPKLKEKPSRGKGDIEWTRNSGLKLTTLNSDLVLESPRLSYGFCTSSHRWTFDQSLEKILSGVKEIQSGYEIQDSNSWPWTVTLTWNRHGWVIDSAHCLTKVNIWPKFKENPSAGTGDTERTRNSRLKPVTLNCDLDLVSARLSYEFCTSSHWGKHMTKV